MDPTFESTRDLKKTKGQILFLVPMFLNHSIFTFKNLLLFFFYLFYLIIDVELISLSKSN